MHSRRRRVVGSVLSVMLCALLLSAARAEAKIVDRIIALVNMEAVTQGDLVPLIQEHAQMLQTFQRVSPDEAQRIAESQAQAHLDELIATSLLVQEARRQEQENPELQITQAALGEFIRAVRAERQLTDDADFERALRQQNQTAESFRREMMRALRIRELLTRELIPRLNVTENDVAAFYEENKAQLESKEQARRALRERRFIEERQTYIARLREKAFVKVFIQF